VPVVEDERLALVVPTELAGLLAADDDHAGVILHHGRHRQRGEGATLDL